MLLSLVHYDGHTEYDMRHSPLSLLCLRFQSTPPSRTHCLRSETSPWPGGFVLEYIKQRFTAEICSSMIELQRLNKAQK